MTLKKKVVGGKKPERPANIEPVIEEKKEDRPFIPQVVEVVVDDADVQSQTDSEQIPQTTHEEQVLEPSVNSSREEDYDLEGVEEREFGKEDERDAAGAKPEDKQRLVNDLFRPVNTPLGPEISVHAKSSLPLMWWIILVVGTALVISFGLFAIVKGKPPISFGFKPTPTPTQSPTPTPSPEPVTRANLKIQVLNGGGVVGAGSKMKSFLEGLGYVVADIGNAKDYTYTSTEIHVKAGKEAYMDLLTSDLKDTYTLGTPSADLGKDNPNDAQVIVGKK
jgi:hypothetical protein